MVTRNHAVQSISKKTSFNKKSHHTERKMFEAFGENVFNENVQRCILPVKSYNSLRQIINNSRPMDPQLAEEISVGIKKWSLKKGATHYCHWFQPLTDLTAEKHDCFFSPSEHGLNMLEFDAKALLQGEPDASSFPNGGIRSTFEARGYTTWDVSSPPFILGRTLVIPSLFISWTGETLDKKTPLLRSMDALGKQALRVLRLFGEKTTERVFPTVGAEQEYFLIDKHFYNLRPDLIACGRTLFGAKPAKGQELEDQYLGTISERVLALMEEVEFELMRIGVPIKTRHNEVAPSQYELTLAFEKAHLAADHYMILMDILKKIADRHGLACLLHEKPFANINGSGKHNNWSLATDSGKNLLEPGETPHENAQFLFFCTAVVRGVYKHSGLLRASIASAGNDHRLGRHEAPPAIISVFLGTELFQIFESLRNNQSFDPISKREIKLGISHLPSIPRHSSDRNRTSPFAFTGNKFEFRAVGSSENISRSNTILNTIVAQSLDHMATKLSCYLEEGKDFNESLNKILLEEIQEFHPILYEGDNYSEVWRLEAEKRGLPNIADTVSAADYFIVPESIALFENYQVFTRRELEGRRAILLEKYVKKIHIEAKSSLDIFLTMVLPAIVNYIKEIDLVSKRLPDLAESLLNEISSEITEAYHLSQLLQTEIGTKKNQNLYEKAVAARDEYLPLMSKLRCHVDRLEELTSNESWPLPKYREMLFLR